MHHDVSVRSWYVFRHPFGVSTGFLLQHGSCCIFWESNCLGAGECCQPAAPAQLESELCRLRSRHIHKLHSDQDTLQSRKGRVSKRFPSNTAYTELIDVVSMSNPLV